MRYQVLLSQSEFNKIGGKEENNKEEALGVRKQISLPGFWQDEKSYNRLLGYRRGAIEALFIEQKGYFRGNGDSSSDYEADDGDIEFLRGVFGEKRIGFSPLSLARNSIVEDFNTMVMAAESERSLFEFLPEKIENRLKNFRFFSEFFEDENFFSKFVSHLSTKCAAFNRKLHREHWKFAADEKFFGPHPPRFTAFQATLKARNLRSSEEKLISEFLENSAESFVQSLESAVKLARLVSLRERLKFLKFQAQIEQENPKVLCDFLGQISLEVQKISSHLTEASPSPKILLYKPSFDFTAFALSLASEFSAAGLDLNSLCPSRISEFNLEVRNIKKEAPRPPIRIISAPFSDPSEKISLFNPLNNTPFKVLSTPPSLLVKRWSSGPISKRFEAHIVQIKRKAGLFLALESDTTADFEENKNLASKNYLQ